MRALLALTLVALSGPQAALVETAPGGPASCLPATLAPATLTGTWTLTWDDSTDLDLDSQSMVCRVALTDVHGALVGRFEGPVLGSTRAAVFTGDTLPGGPAPVVTLVQREEGYSCAYLLSKAGHGHLSGTWRDSRGEGGTAVFAREQRVPDGADVIRTTTGGPPRVTAGR